MERRLSQYISTSLPAGEHKRVHQLIPKSSQIAPAISRDNTCSKRLRFDLMTTDSDRAEPMELDVADPLILDKLEDDNERCVYAEYTIF
jgi:hypothetical protein